MGTIESVEDFATLLAHLANPFALRRVVLEANGLTEAELAALTTRWTREMMGPDGPNAELVKRYKTSYATMASALRAAHYRIERLAAASAPAPAAPVSPARFVGPPQPFRAEAANVALSGVGDAPPLASQDTEPLPGPESLDSTVELQGDPGLLTLPFATPAHDKPLAVGEGVEDVADLDATLPLPSPPTKDLMKGRPRANHGTVEALPRIEKAALPFKKSDDDKSTKR